SAAACGWGDDQAMRIALAAFLYFAVVFAVGFALGPVRVLLLEPRWGPVAAVVCEAPILIAAMLWAARSAPRAAGVGPGSSMLLVGLGALLLQQSADLAVGLLMRGMSVSELMAQFATAEGRVYLVLLTL